MISIKMNEKFMKRNQATLKEAPLPQQKSEKVVSEWYLIGRPNPILVNSVITRTFVTLAAS